MKRWASNTNLVQLFSSVYGKYRQGRIQDFGQGGGRDIKCIFTPRGARFHFNEIL